MPNARRKKSQAKASTQKSAQTRALEREVRELRNASARNPYMRATSRVSRGSSVGLTRPSEIINRLGGRFRGGTLLDPYLRAWASLVDDPGHAARTFEGSPIKIPLSSGTVPCVSLVVTRAVDQQITTLLANGCAEIHLTPRAIEETDGWDSRSNPVKIDAVTREMGPCSSSGYTVAPALGWIRDNGSSITPREWANVSFWDASLSIDAAGEARAILASGDYDNPSRSSNVSGDSFRLIAGMVDIIPLATVGNTSGVIRSVQSFEVPYNGQTVGRLQGTAGFEKRYVLTDSGKGYVYSPNCDYVLDVEYANAVDIIVEYPCRWVIHIDSGANISETYNLVGIFHYEVSMSTRTAMSSPGLVSPHAAHGLTGLSRAAVTGGRVLAHVARHHAESHPVLSKLMKAGEAGLATLGGYEGIATMLAFL